MKKSDKPHVAFLFWGDNKQHMPVFNMMISSWVMKVLNIIVIIIISTII